MLYWFGKIVFTIPVWLALRPRIIGYKNLFFRGKGIIVSNHHSLCDPIWIGFVSPRIVHFMAKSELFKTPLSRFFLKILLAFPVNRHHADISSLKQAVSVLDSGRVFGIFPEGKRSVTGELDTFEKGAAFLALRCNAPIIPVYSDPKMYRRFRIRMIVGEPIDPKSAADTMAGRPTEALALYLRDRMQELKNRLEEPV